jgi:hypothetical protein
VTFAVVSCEIGSPATLVADVHYDDEGYRPVKGLSGEAMPDRRAFVLGAAAASFAEVKAYADVPPDAAIQAVLQGCVGKDLASTGIVAVVSGSSGSRLFTYGTFGAVDSRKLDGDTVFDIASPRF